MRKSGFFDKSDAKFLGINLVLAVLVAVGILIGLIAWLRTYTQHGVEVEVNDVRGMVLAEAEPLLSAEGLVLVVIDSTYSDQVPFGTIVEQDPKPFSHAKHGRAVYVTINATTKRQVTMPNLQVGTQVRLVVGYGRGTEEVEVPSVIGLTLQEARALLLSHRLTVGAISYDEPEEEGVNQYVYRQIPAEGSKLIEGETVALKLSKQIEKAATTGSENDNEEWF